MHGRPLLHLLLLAALSLAIEQKKFHPTKDGHLRIINPDSDDSELLIAESSGYRNKKESKPDGEGRVKTLAQQVADGKYGLIQKELFSTPPKRPGVLSYEENPEVSNDNADNLGGLDQNEIWLAENHLLILRGGKYPPPDSKNDNIASLWQPIDNYKAKLHQVKIPLHPKVPPPFPVQLTEDGPLQILGTNSSRTINASDAASLYPLSSPDGAFYQQDPYSQVTYPDQANLTAGPVEVPVPFNATGDYGSGMLVPTLNTTLPPFLGYLPPGAVVLPPPNNQTDLYDDDDPSIYYPPPYSFFYPKDNSSVVPPGPLVPGIVLPPPPNFFTLLEETTTSKPPATVKKPQRQRKPTTIHINKQIRPTTTSLPPTTQRPVKIYPVKHSYYSNEIKPTKSTTTPVRQDQTYVQRPRDRQQPARKRPEDVTILRPVRPPQTPPPRIYSYENEISNKPFTQYGPPAPTLKKKISVTTTQVPLKYYTTSNNIDSKPYQAENYAKSKSLKTTVSPAQYFYYEESPKRPSTTPRVPIQQNHYSTEQYYIQPRPSPTPRPRRPQYIYVTGRPYNTQRPKFRFIQQPVRDSFSVHIAQLQKQINQYIPTVKTTRRPSPRPVYQYSFEAANYQPQQHDHFRPSPQELDQNQFRPVPLPKYNVEIQQAIEIIPSTEGPRYRKPSRPIFVEHTTQRPSEYYPSSTQGYDYDKVTQKAKYVQNIATPRPVAQYSFEVTPNPVYQGYYTKPDEGFFDDNTKHYFTMFGKKLPAVTTPIPSVEITPSIELSYARLKQQGAYQQQQKPISLEGDTYVNYANPRPTVNPDAEFVPIRGNNNNQPNYPKVIRYTARPPVYAPSQREPSHQNPEIIKAIPIEVPTSDGDGSFISYQLPGDQGAHFYFLTPQLAERKDQGAGYFYSQPSNVRIRRKDKSNNDKNR